MQARAHALLKSKEAELRTARGEAQAESAEQLSRAHEEMATNIKELQLVGTPLLINNISQFMFCQAPTLPVNQVIYNIGEYTISLYATCLLLTLIPDLVLKSSVVPATGT